MNNEESKKQFVELGKQAQAVLLKGATIGTLHSLITIRDIKSLEQTIKHLAKQ